MRFNRGSVSKKTTLRKAAVLLLVFMSIAGPAHSQMQTEENVVVVEKDNADSLKAAIGELNRKGRGTLILAPGLERGPLPERVGPGVRVVDLRYNGGIHMIRGNHPRIEGIWPQYSGLGTGLAKNIVISDVVSNHTPVESWEGKRKQPVSTQFKHESEYPHAHNHYQNLLSEVWNFTDNINGVALWGDSSAFVPGAKAWGGFLSARSWPLHWDRYVPEGTKGFDDKDFDAQLVGLEIDVLNAGRPELIDGNPVWSKIGLQVVGFGRRNTAAIEIRSEDTDAQMENARRRGTWKYGLIANNSLDRDSTFIFSAFPEARIGLDFGMTRYHDGALRLRTESSAEGIVFNDRNGGQIGVDTRTQTLTLAVAKNGLRIVSNDGSKELFAVEPSGAIRFARSLTSHYGDRFQWGVIALLVAGFLGLMVQNVSLRRKLQGLQERAWVPEAPGRSPTEK